MPFMYFYLVLWNILRIFAAIMKLTDKHIEEMKNQQKSLSDSIQSYQNKIVAIDEKISKIKVEKKEVNNYYTQKKEEIKNADKKQIDSLLRSRYNF